MGKNRLGSVLNQTSVSQHFLPFQLVGCAAGRLAREAVLSWDPGGHQRPFPKAGGIAGMLLPTCWTGGLEHGLNPTGQIQHVNANDLRLLHRSGTSVASACYCEPH